MLQKIDKKDKEAFQKYLAGRASEISPQILVQASAIVEDVRKNGDAAVLDYTRRFDKVDLPALAVDEETIAQRASLADPAFVAAMREAAKNIADFHEKQKQTGYRMEKEDGIYLGQRVLPLESVGIYVPGGRALYPSSVLMNAIPAKIAGVQRVVMVTPPDAQGNLPASLAAAAQVAGVDEIYLMGGAQAVAALAYGTESVAGVDKIVGPGNIFVAAAKKLVFGKVDIDMIAGPSEILVIADDSANPAFVAADLISQAEHDPMASAILVTTSQDLADKVCQILEIQSAALPKKAIIEESLANYGRMIVVDSLEEAVELSNLIAPEHLELQVENPEQLLESVKNAGSVFMGYAACESIGDYFGGTNHVLPTSGTARFSSALSVDAFIKKSSYLYWPMDALQKHGHKIITMAQEENLDGHANAVKVRLEHENNV